MPTGPVPPASPPSPQAVDKLLQDMMANQGIDLAMEKPAQVRMEYDILEDETEDNGEAPPPISFG